MCARFDDHEKYIAKRKKKRKIQNHTHDIAFMVLVYSIRITILNIKDSSE